MPLEFAREPGCKWSRKKCLSLRYLVSAEEQLDPRAPVVVPRALGVEALNLRAVANEGGGIRNTWEDVIDNWRDHAIEVVAAQRKARDKVRHSASSVPYSRPLTRRAAPAVRGFASPHFHRLWDSVGTQAAERDKIQGLSCMPIPR